MRRFTQWLVLAAALVCPRQLAAQSTVDGNTYLTEVLAMLERHPTITARLRHQADFGDSELVGSGNYWQGRTPAGQRINRWEMQTQVAGETSSFLQVFDGNYLWTDRRLPSGRTVRRLDVATLHMRLRTRRSHTRGQENLLATATLGRGGLPELVADLLTQRLNFALHADHVGMCRAVATGQLGELGLLCLELPFDFPLGRAQPRSSGSPGELLRTTL